MKKDHELIRLARENRNVDHISERLNKAPMTILKAAKRLGIYLGPNAPPERDGSLKAKSK